MKQVISVVGAGGKTTVVENLSQNLSKYFDVLVSTTTKMKLPQAYKYDRLIISKDEFEDNKSYFLKYNIVADKIEINFGVKAERVNMLNEKIDETKNIENIIVDAKKLEEELYLLDKNRLSESYFSKGENYIHYE